MYKFLHGKSLSSVEVLSNWIWKGWQASNVTPYVQPIKLVLHSVDLTNYWSGCAILEALQIKLDATEMFHYVTWHM